MSAEPTPFSLGFDALLTFLQRNDRTRKRPASFRGFLIYPEESLQLHRYRVVFADRRKRARRGVRVPVRSRFLLPQSGLAGDAERAVAAVVPVPAHVAIGHNQ
jgi:hypothetical protein